MSESKTLPKIGILGGTFDPPHLGHLAMAVAARDALGLDEVVFVPAYRNPLKTRLGITPAHRRLAMVKLLIGGEPSFSVSDIELTRGQLSYAVDTLSEMSFLRPAEYWFILGSDSLKRLYDWHQIEKLSRLTRFAAILRAPDTEEVALRDVPELYREVIDFVPMEAHPASSTKVRDAILTNRPYHHLVPEAVAEYIEKNELYR